MRAKWRRPDSDRCLFSQTRVDTDTRMIYYNQQAIMKKSANFHVREKKHETAF